MDNVDIIIIGQGFQHFTDRGSDQFKGQSRNTSTPATHTYTNTTPHKEMDSREMKIQSEFNIIMVNKRWRTFVFAQLKHTNWISIRNKKIYNIYNC